MGVVKNIMVRAVADFSGLINGSRMAGDAVRGMADRMNSSSRGMVGSLGGVATKLAALAGIYFSLDFIKDATQDAIEFDARMGTLNNRMGASAVGFNKWADTTGKAMGYSKMQIAEYGNTFSNMLYDAAKDQQDLATKTQKFLEASAIVRSKTGLSQEEVSKRMRSAMNMEADGADELGVNVRATAVEHSKAFKELAGGVKNFSDLSSGMQKNIMYTYLLDEVTRRYGTTVSDNAATKTAIFTASLKDLQLHMGQAFLPIWESVLPALTTLINYLSAAAQKAAVFMRVLFGYSAKDTTKSAQDTTQAFKGQTGAVNDLTKAHKELAKSVAGFDEVNTLAQPTASDAPKISDPKMDTKEETKAEEPAPTPVDTSAIEKAAMKVKQFFKDIKDTWEDLKSKFVQNKEKIIAAVEAIGITLALVFGPAALTALVGFIASFARSIMFELVPALWEWAIAQLAATWEIVLVIAAIALLAIGIYELILHWKEVKKWAIDVWHSIVELWGVCASWFNDNVLQPIITFFVKFGTEIAKGSVKAYDAIIDAFKTAATWFYDNVIKPIVDFFVQFAVDLATGATNGFNAIVNAFITASTWFYDNVIKPIVKFFVQFALDLGTGSVKALKAITDAFKDAGTWFYDNVIKPIVDLFVNFAIDVGKGAVKVWNALCGAFKSAETWFKTNVIDVVVEKFGTLKDKVKEKADDAWTAIKTAFSTVATWFDTNIITPIKTAFGKISDGLGTGLVTAFKSVYNTVAGYINSMLDMWNSITGSNPITKGLKISYSLPMLAKGGITNGAMAAVIGDNAGGREVVSPLSDLMGMVSSAVIQAMAFNQPSKSSQQAGDIVLNIDGRQFARIIKPYVDTENTRVGGTNVMLNRI